MYRLANRVAIDEGVLNFGSRVAQIVPWHKVETLGALISQSSTLNELLNTFCKVASGQRALADFRVSSDEGTTWFGYHGPNIIKDDVQMEFYRLTGMIQLVQLGAGSGWRPKRVELRMPNIDVKKACKLISGGDVKFSSKDSRFSLPDLVLNLPVNLDIPETQTAGGYNYDINANFLNTLKQIIPIYLGRRPCTVEIIARVTELEVRTLQRLLQGHGTSFSEVLGKVRFELAKSKLTKKSTTMTSITVELGYTNATHFVRAFKRWSGMTPGQYRKQLPSN
jgi:AraC-like DNA-binding protein